jgi:hypothetical protein
MTDYTRINVRDYGAVGDGRTDDTAAIQAAIDATAPVVDPLYGKSIGSRIVFPPGVYLVGNTACPSYASPNFGSRKAALRVTKNSSLEGIGGAGPNGGAVVLLVNDGYDGILIEGLGGGSLIQGLQIVAKGSTHTKGMGVVVHANNVTVAQCAVSNFAEHGVCVESGPGINCNYWALDDVWVEGNHGNGVNVQGEDSNGGTATQITARKNLGFGVYDGTLAGATWMSCYTTNNGPIETWTEPNACNTATTTKTGNHGAGYGKAPNNASMFIGCFTEDGKLADLPGATIVGGTLVRGSTYPIGGNTRLGAHNAMMGFANRDMGGNAGHTVTAMIPSRFGLGGALMTFDYAKEPDPAHASATNQVLKSIGYWTLGRGSPDAYPQRHPYVAPRHVWCFKWDNTMVGAGQIGFANWWQGNVNCGAPIPHSVQDPRTADPHDPYKALDIIPFGWTDAYHAVGPGLPFFGKPLLNSALRYTRRFTINTSASNHIEPGPNLFTDNVHGVRVKDTYVATSQLKVSLALELSEKDLRNPLVNVVIGAYAIHLVDETTQSNTLLVKIVNLGTVRPADPATLVAHFEVFSHDPSAAPYDPASITTLTKV